MPYLHTAVHPDHLFVPTVTKVKIKLFASFENALPSLLSAANPGFSRLHATVQTVKKKKTSTQAGQTSISAAQFAANHANSQLSTGPRSEEGKRISSLNAVKTGLTGQTVLLPSDDAAVYERHIQRFIADHQPESDRESELVQSLADAQWRLNRIPGLEMAIFARGRVQFAEKFAEYDHAMAAALTDAETLVVYQREIRGLQTQESRIRRHYRNDLAELKQLQKQRTVTGQLSLPSPAAFLAPPQLSPSVLAKMEQYEQQNGFEFSTMVEEIDAMSPEQLQAEILRLEAELAAN
jgi:hypothetical protein